MTRATIITDASFCHRTKAAGWAAWVRIDGRPDPIKKYAEFRQPVESAQEAEMLAAINGLWLAAQHGATVALVQTDCLAVVHMLDGKTKRKDLIHKFNRAVGRAGVAHVQFSGRHVKGHTSTDDARSYVNRWCDNRAKTAMNGQRKSG